MSVEIGIIYRTGWAVFTRKPGREDKGLKSTPKEFYRIYEVEDSMADEVTRVLRARAVHLTDQRIMPSNKNYRSVFPDLSDLLILK
ncbi:hypothetical protein FJZ18_02905 [Candidatus Pacearchaeota archaeon]|nr:hypothetical protein [Candidatus Pacearchaeota archaeon]